MNLDLHHRSLVASQVLASIGFACTLSAQPLTTLDYRVTGQSLQITPAALAVPKNIGGSVATTLAGTPPAGSYVEAFLRGPSFPARRLVGAPGAPLLLPPLNLVGDYSLDGIRLADGTTNETLLEGTPSSVPVHVFDEVLISRVTSRPLTLEEIQGRGIIIDEQNFRAIEFEVGFVLDGKTIPVRFPVVTPAATSNTEIIPAAELEERLRQVEEINDQLSQAVVIPPELETSRFNMQVKGLNFQFVDPGEGEDLGLSVPPIPALMVIPGNIGFLNQFFSVMIFTENGAPAGSALSATNIAAELVLPTGPDRVAGTFPQPGDDPLRFARVGQAAVIQPVQPVRQLGPDGKLGTPDDVPRLQPGETGQGEFLVEGLQEGLHVMDLKLTADLEGLAAGVVKIEGRAAGSVLVRNPKFSFAFAHPRTVRAGEPYDAFVTILNTSQVPANLVSVTLNSLSISGGVLESDETVELGTISPGQTAMAKFRIRSQRTGAITFSNITTSDDSLVGRFRLHAGVDERGVALSPDTLVLPNFVDELPADLLNAANRVLGQALSIAKAGQPPAGVLRVSTEFLKQKAIELAEAGQRMRYGESLARVVPDILLDWQGARDFSPGWDQILRETNAGLEWRQALMRAIEGATPGGPANARLLAAAREFAGRGESWFFGAVSAGDFQADPPSANELNLAKAPTERATLDKSSLAKALGYPGRAGAWMAGADKGVFEWKFASQLTAPFQTSVVLVRADGTAAELLWQLDSIAAGACVSFDATGSGESLEIDDNCDGTVDRTLAAQRTDFSELPPAVLAVRQEPEILVGRPAKPCPLPRTTNAAGESVPVNNYANVLAVLFSKPMIQSLANVPEAYTLGGGNEAAFVQMQPGGRVALITMREPVGKLVPRQMSVAPTVKDARGNVLATTPVQVQSRLVEGITVRGRVIRADGSFSAGVPVTLTYYDEVEAGLSGCLPFVVRPAQVFTDIEGQFQFDFVVAGIPYSVSATDTSGLSPDLIGAILESTRGDALDRARLLELAKSPSVQNTLLADFAVGALPQAIAKAEGLDRALVRDSVLSGSPREGTTSVYALRFRGRGSVIGQVLAADGVTPVPDGAVNLFPDPGSRELGRGLLSDADGRFAFFGVPLGTFSIEATSPTGPARVISDVITIPGETRNIAVVLSASAPPLGELQGRVTEPDGTRHAGASVFVGRFDPVTGKFGSVVAIATSDVNGFWHATKVTAVVHDLIAVSADGKRKGERRDILTAADAVNTVNLTLQARATVTGRVETSTGVPVNNALVGGGDALVRTDVAGRFTLTGVPTGPRTIAAVLERDPAAGIDFPRTGSGNVNVLPGAENFVIVRLDPAARIIGRVLDENGSPMPGADVAIPQIGGFLWADTDAQGNFEFAGLGIGKYDLSAPAPPHEDVFDGEAAARSLLTATHDEMLATIGEAFAAFTGVNNPLLNGEGANFNPSKWGFTKDVKLDFDGQTVVADVRLLGAGTIGGVVKNGQGVPIGARVRLTGIGPAGNGAPTMVIRGERDSDPALGTFEFPDQALIGDWGLQAASPFFPVVVSTSGRTTTLDPDDTDTLLQFPSVKETNGSLAGVVLRPDGSPAGANVKVQISFGPDFIIRTAADGRFATQAGTFTLPAINAEGRRGVGYLVTATDETDGATGEAAVTVMPAQVNSVTVRLLGRGDTVVTVKRADGTPAEGAALEIQGGAFPRERFEGTTNAAGQVTFQNLFEGPYGACATLGTGLARIAGRVSLNVISGITTQAALTLGGTGTVRGTFLAQDAVTPIAFANVALGSLAFTSTDAAGGFIFPDVPLGSYRLTATDAVTGRSGSANATLAATNETSVVTIVETALGEVFGRVINALANGDVPNAEVTLQHNDPFVPQRTVTTGPDGAFRFPGTPAGGIGLTAMDPATAGRGTAFATLPATAIRLEINIALAPVANLTVTVLEPDGTTPATLATVRISAGNAILAVDADAQGRARFDALPLGIHNVTAESRATGLTRRWAGAFVSLTSQGAEETLVLTLRGVGTLTGTVFQGDGTTPSPGTQVTLSIGSEEVTVPGGVVTKPSASQTENVIADPQGLFIFSNIPVGEVRLTATSQALGASETVVVLTGGQIVTRNLILSASGTVAGRILRVDGTTPAAGTDVLLTFTSQSGLPGRINARTLGDGLFSIGPVPVGDFQAQITNADVGGLALRDARVTANNQTVNLGDIVLDEAFPTVVQVTPRDTATEVSTTSTVALLFSEALANSSLDPGGIFIRRSDTGALVPATLTLTAPAGEADLRLVRLAPLTPLESEKTFQVVVVDGELVNALGAVTNRGPRDLVGRPLGALFSASFTTRDGTPPTLLSFTPENGAEQVDVRSPVRLSFDEPIQPGAVATLMGPGGAVAGTTSLGLNSLVLTFVPSFDLAPNGTFTVSVEGVKDLAGNDLVGQPRRAAFKSLDTLGPVLSALRLKNNQPPLANTPVILEAAPVVAEPGIRVRFSADFTLLGTTQADGLEFPFTLPARGTVVFRAIAIDRFGNEGPVAELAVLVQENQPPGVTFTRLNPLTGPAFSGGGFAVRVNVTDDGAVTDFRAAATGAAIVPLQTNTTGDPIVVQGTVPAAAVPGSKITLIAQATDNANRTTGEQRFEFDVADGTAPVVAFVNPAANAIADTTQPFALTIDTTENSGDVTLEVTLSGGVTGTQSVVVDGTPNLAARRTLNFDLSAALPTGGTFTATARATDAAGRVGAASRSFLLPDRRAPQLASAAPAQGAAQQSLWTDVVLTFDGAMKPDTFIPANVEFPGAFTVTANAANTVFTLQATNALTPGQAQNIRLKPGLTDAAGNPWQDTGGAAVPPEGKLIAFTTASLAAATPAPNTRVVPGQTITARTDFQSGLGADLIAFQTLLGNEVTQVVNPATSTTASGAVTISLAAAANESLLVIARKAGRPAFTLPAIPLEVRPRAADDDGDGISNGQEADSGLDPFRDDRLDDNDGDGRSNAQETLAGTDPSDPDSDDDGLNDGGEFTAGTNPLLADTDSDGLKDGAEAPLGANPLAADTDGDTLNDGFEIGVGRLSIVPGAFTWPQAKADAESRGGHLLTVTSAAEQAGLELVLPNAAASGGWIGLADQFIEGEFAWVTGEPATLLRFGPGEPNNSNNEDAVHLRGDGLWNDANASANFPYLLELGFFTNPAQGDSDGDGIADAVDTFPGQQNRAPVAGNDTLIVNAGEPRNLAISTELLDDDSDPDGSPIAFATFSQPPAGGTVTQPNATTLVFTPAGGFGGAANFTYTINDPSGLTATATVTVTVGTNTRPLAGNPGTSPGFALEFDGNDDFVNIPKHPTLNLDQFAGWTIEAWVKPTAFNHRAFPVIYAMGRWVASLGLDATNGKFDSWNNDVAQILSTGTPALGEWTHVALVHDGTTRRFFINGQASGSAASVPVNAIADPNRIGAAGFATPDSRSYFRGSIDEVRVWSRALNATEINETLGVMLGGAENGLTGYWPFEEGAGLATDDATVNGNVGTLGTAAASAPQWVTSDAPILTRSQEATTVVDTAILLPLIGSDPDNAPLTARILSLPAHGQLFQFAAGAIGTEIAAVPATVTDAERRVVYQPQTGYVGDDGFRYSMFDGGLESFPARTVLHVVPVLAPAADDLWDVSNGAVITAGSGFHPSSAGNNMFGATSGVEPGNAIFADGHPAGFTHFIEWETPSFLRLEGSRLFATQGGDSSGQRTFTEMRLFGRMDAGDPFTLLTTFRPGANPYFAPVRAVIPIAPFIGQEFRAEFDQFGNFAFPGPRIEELDAIGEAVVLVPTPALVVLQNATADRTQGGFDVAQLIDGIVVGGAHGWAGDVGGTPPMTAVFEAAQNLGATVDTEFVFGLPQPFGGSHFIGNLRLSATTDSRDQFADGLGNGGDITANWTVLNVIEVTSTGGESLTVLADGSVLVGGTMPSTTTYTVRAKGISGGVTGFRLELLEHPSLPNNGPGRVGHGNWVLAEFTVDVNGATLVPNRAPRSQPDTVETPQNLPATTGNVLANDTDTEGDTLAVLDFTQPAAGTGTVVNNGNGTFTYTPPNAAFSGSTSFTYRATDGHQPGTPAIVTITVHPSLERVWTNPAGGNWSVAANWLNGAVPGPDDVAVIGLDGTYTVTLDASVTVTQLRLGGTNGTQTLNLNGQTLAIGGAGSVGPRGRLAIRGDGRLTLQNGALLTVGGTFDFEQGTLTAGGRVIIDTAGVGNLTTGSAKFLDGVIENRGTLNYTGNGLFFGRDGPNLSARIENAAGGTFIVDGEGDFTQNHGSPNYRIENTGTFIKRGAGTTTVVNNPIFFATTGTVQVEAGTLQFNHTTSLAGTITGAGGISFVGGTHTIAQGTAFDATALNLTSTTMSLGVGVAPQLATVNINASTLSFAESRTLTALSIRGDGRLTLPNDSAVTVTGTFSFEQGTLTAGGRVIIDTAGVGNLTTGSAKFLDGVIENRGTLNYTGNGLFFGRDGPNLSARIENAAGGTFIVDGEGDFTQNHGSPNYRIENTGTFIKRGAGTTTVVNNPIFFATTGTVQVEAGTLQFNHTTSLAGTITGAGGISFVGGTHTITQGTSFDATALNLTSTTMSLGVGVAPQLATVNINASTLSFAESRTLTTLTIRGDGRLTLPNDSAVTVTGTFSFEQGTLTAGGRVIIDTTGVGNLTTGSAKFLDGVIENRGTLNYTGNGLFFGRDGPNLSARIENAAGGTFIVEGEGDFTQNHGSPNYRIENTGTFIKRGAGTTTVVNNPIFFATTGTVQVEAGTLQFNHTTSLAGTITGAGGISFVGGTHTIAQGTSFDATALNLTSTTMSLGVGVAPQLATVNINASTLSFAESRTLTALSIRGDGRLTLPNDSAVTVTGTFSFEQGTLTAGGRVVIDTTGVGNLTTGTGKFLDGVIENRGTLNYTGNGLFFGRDGPNLSARIENAAGGTFIVDGEGDFTQNHGSPNYRIENTGTFIKRGAGTTTTISNPVLLASTGTIHLEAGTLAPSGGFTQNGTLRGTGTVAANVTNNGTVRPDSVPGGLTIQGTFSQTAAGRLELALRGRDTTLAHRSLRITGAATFAGALDVSLASPFDEPQNSTFAIASYASRTGDFASVTGLLANLGYDFTRAFSATTLDLTVTTKGDVPSPPPLALALVGFADWIDSVRSGRTQTLGPQDDADADGMVNFLEYALGTSPFAPQPHWPMRFDLRPTAAGFEITLSFRHRTDVPGLVHSVEMSPDGRAWTLDEAAVALRRIDQSPDGPNFILETRVYQFTQASQLQQFFRVNVMMKDLSAQPDTLRRARAR